MFSTNPYTRRRQQKAAAFFVVSGVFTAVSLCVALQKAPPSSPWAATLAGNEVVIVRDVQTGKPQSLIAPLNHGWPSVERINRVQISGDQVLVEARKMVGARPEGYQLEDVTLIYSARTGVQVKK